ncbi:Ras GTPase-activating protein 1 [Dinochytrium kinnereticum]|nr:Ras GTPase-activating protein 1 [Dinochytrium kinnereticum]
MPRSIDRYSEESLRQCHLVLNLLEQRQNCEEQYSKRLRDIVTSLENFGPIENPETDAISATLYSSTIWNAVKNVIGNMEKAAESHMRLSQAIQKDIVDQYRDFLKAFEVKKREQVEHCLELNKKLNNAGINLQKAKQDLDSARQTSSEANDTLIKAQAEQIKKKDVDRLMSRSTQASDRVEQLVRSVSQNEADFNNLRSSYSKDVEPMNKALRDIEESRQLSMKKILGDLNFLESVAVARVAKHINTASDFIAVVDTENDIRDFSAEVLTDDPELTTSVLPRNTIFSGTLKIRQGDGLGRPWISAEVALTSGFLYILGQQPSPIGVTTSSNAITQIPLAEGSIQVSTVDDSYFQTPWCFQVISLVSSELSPTGTSISMAHPKRLVLNFSASSPDDRDSWIYHLRMYSSCCMRCLGFYREIAWGAPVAGSPASIVSPLSATSPSSPSVPLRSGIVRSMQLWVTEAKDLAGASSGKCNTYCIILFNDMKQARTCVKGGLSPFWGEEYRFSGLSHRDHEIGYVSINLNSLKTGKRHEDWYPIKPFGKHSNEEGASAGSIRISYILLACQTLPMTAYQTFLETITEPTLLCARTIAPLLTHERDELCKTFLNIFMALSIEVNALKSLTAAEIASTDDPNIIFRGNSIATKMLDQYMKIIGMGYLHSTIGALVKGVYDSRESCEVDPAKIGSKGVEKDSDQIKRRWKRLMNHVNSFWDAISQSSEKCPIELVLVFSHMRSQLRSKFQDERYVWAGISGFIFLRFFCPAILSPKLFNIMSEHPDPQTLRTLTLIAKILQNLANLSEFEGKEPHMEPTNDWLINHAPDMKHFINSISSMSANAPVPATNRSRLDLRRDAAALHSFFAGHMPEIAVLPKTLNNPIIVTLKDEVEAINIAINKAREGEEPPGRRERPLSCNDSSHGQRYDLLHKFQEGNLIRKTTLNKSPTGSVASLDQKKDHHVPRISVSMPPVRLKTAHSGSRMQLRPKSMLLVGSNDVLESDGAYASSNSINHTILSHASNLLSGFGLGHHGHGDDTPFLDYRDSVFSDCQPLGPKSSRDNTTHGVKKNSEDSSDGRRSSVSSDISTHSTGQALSGSKMSLFKSKGKEVKSEERDRERSGFSLRSLLQVRKPGGSVGQDGRQQYHYSSNASLAGGGGLGSVNSLSAEAKVDPPDDEGVKDNPLSPPITSS